MKRLALLGLAVAGLLSGACGGDKEVSPFDMAAEECGVSDEDLKLIREGAGSGINGKGPGYLTYRTSDDRRVTIFKLGDGSWGWVGNGGCRRLGD